MDAGWLRYCSGGSAAEAHWNQMGTIGTTGTTGTTGSPLRLQATRVSADANSRPVHATHTPPSPELTRTGHRNPPTPLLHVKETRRSNT